MNITKYFNRKDELEITEKMLFELIDRIDNESYKLYCEVIDLDLNSYYKVDNLYIRINNLADRLEEIVVSYNLLEDLELDRLSFASKETQLKKILLVLTFSFSAFVNIYIGIFGYFILSNLITNSFMKKVELISRRVNALDKKDLSIIGTTLHNASNLLKGKMTRLYAMEESEEISQDVIIANNFIVSFLSDNLPDIDIKTLPLNSKQIIIKQLQKDLSSDSDDINELLSELKSKNDNEIKLSKELTR